MTASLMVVILIHALYAQVGFVRLLGLPYIVVWTPLVIFLFSRLRKGELHPIARIALSIFATTIAISLIFDYGDGVRYLLGERGFMLSK